ncbi:hypothetical protein [Vibrio breoganii]|uniref:hypothetical protein n=1 Tax=Vibrio breoganii TaxID=553239 RepID=UPI000C8371BF|nr:hypothetical protein [Vibrio breoganii]PML85194.1 hypothetical protein BCT68_07620 [Vibrio breoganii]
MSNITSKMVNHDTHKSWERFLTVLPMYTPLEGDLLISAALDLYLGPNPIVNATSLPRTTLGFDTLAQQEKLMTIGDKLWRFWQSDPDVLTALEHYSNVCLHQSSELLCDSHLHHKVRGFGLLKYYYSVVHIGVFNDKSDLWDRHCRLTRFRLWAEHLNCTYCNMTFEYNLAGIQFTQ